MISEAYHLIAQRGLRRGEAAGLRWCDIDLDGKTAVITQQLQQYDGRLAICPPKTAHSTRVIALDHTTVAALRAHRDRQRAEAGAYGPCPARKQDSAGDLQVIRASGGVRVLVDQAAQDGFSADVLCADAGHGGAGSVMFAVRDALGDALVRPGHVVMRLVVGQDRTQVCLAENQHAVQDLPAQGTD